MEQTDEPGRYHRQMLLRGIGEEGQRRLGRGRAVLVGCGALGTVIAESLARAGVGHLRIIDRDIVEMTNLQRQTLFAERDVSEAQPKAVAAAARLAAVNSTVTFEPIVADFTARTAERLADEADVIVDGTDNFQTRYLLNDLAVKLRRPYVYGGAVGTSGLMYVVMPGDGPCLRCIFGDQPTAGGPTCDTVGVLGPAAGVVANLQAAEAIKLLSGNVAAVNRRMVSLDLWTNDLRQIDVACAYEPGACACCGQGRLDYLDNQRRSEPHTLCGRNAVQFSPTLMQDRGEGEAMELTSLAARLSAHGAVKQTAYLLRAEVRERGRDFQLTVFTDGRVIVHGTDDPSLARALYARYIGA